MSSDRACQARFAPVAVGGSHVEPVPTLSQWMLLLLGVLIGGAGWLGMRRRVG